MNLEDIKLYCFFSLFFFLTCIFSFFLGHPSPTDATPPNDAEGLGIILLLIITLCHKALVFYVEVLPLSIIREETTC